MLSRNVADQLLNEDGFSDTGTAEQTDLSALCIRCDQINNLNSGLQNFLYRALIRKLRRLAVNFPAFCIRKALLSVNGIPQYIEQTSKVLISDRNLDPAACGQYRHILLQSLTGGKHDAANGIVSDVLCHLHHGLFSVIVRLQCGFNNRKGPFRKLNVYNRSHNLSDLSDLHCQDSFPAAIFFLRLFFNCSLLALAPAATSVISCVIAA